MESFSAKERPRLRRIPTKRNLRISHDANDACELSREHLCSLTSPSHSTKWPDSFLPDDYEDFDSNGIEILNTTNTLTQVGSMFDAPDDEFVLQHLNNLPLVDSEIDSDVEEEHEVQDEPGLGLFLYVENYFCKDASRKVSCAESLYSNPRGANSNSSLFSSMSADFCSLPNYEVSSSRKSAPIAIPAAVRKFSVPADKEPFFAPSIDRSIFLDDVFELEF